MLRGVAVAMCIFGCADTSALEARVERLEIALAAEGQIARTAMDQAERLDVELHELRMPRWACGERGGTCWRSKADCDTWNAAVGCGGWLPIAYCPTGELRGAPTPCYQTLEACQKAIDVLRGREREFIGRCFGVQ